MRKNGFAMSFIHKKYNITINNFLLDNVHILSMPWPVYQV